MATPAEHIGKLETDFKELKAKYDMFFRGFERLPPEREYLDFTKIMHQMSTQRMANTGLRFRLSNLRQTFLTHDRLWQKNMRAIEEGTFQRDVRRASSAAKTPPKAQPEAVPDPATQQQPAATAPQPAAATPRPAAPAPGGATPGGASSISDNQVRAIYNTLVRAKQQVGDNSPLSYDGLASSLKKQIPALMQRHGAKSVEFKVVLKDGKASLKAVPKG